MIIVYDKRDGRILRKTSDIPDPMVLYHHHTQEFKDNLSWISVYNPPLDIIRKYKVVNDKLILKTQEELNPFDMNRTKEQLIQLSKTRLLQHLENNPILFTDGKRYSVTQEKQNLLNNAITVYQMKIQSGLPAELKWNATGEECTLWTLEDIVALALAIANYVEPLVTYQQAIEVQIRECTTKEELESIVIDYATV